MRQILLIHRPK